NVEDGDVVGEVPGRHRDVAAEDQRVAVGRDRVAGRAAVLAAGGEEVLGRVGAGVDPEDPTEAVGPVIDAAVEGAVGDPPAVLDDDGRLEGAGLEARDLEIDVAAGDGGGELVPEGLVDLVARGRIGGEEDLEVEVLAL